MSVKIKRAHFYRDALFSHIISHNDYSVVVWMCAYHRIYIQAAAPLYSVCLMRGVT